MAADIIENYTEWHFIKEKRPSSTKLPDGSFGTYEVEGIRRSDGLTVTREGLSREKWETFLCKGDFGESRLGLSQIARLSIVQPIV